MAQATGLASRGLVRVRACQVMVPACRAKGPALACPAWGRVLACRVLGQALVCPAWVLVSACSAKGQATQEKERAKATALVRAPVTRVRVTDSQAQALAPESRGLLQRGCRCRRRRKR